MTCEPSTTEAHERRIVGRVVKRGAPLRDRLMAKVRISDAGCWEWLGRRNWAGYGRLTVTSPTREVQTHRLAYELFVGPIPDGMQLDHVCRNRLCCNPKHLEPVTARENQRRGTSPVSANMAATHCLRGHPLDDDNTYLHKGRRQCKECQRTRTREYLRKRRATALSRAGRAELR